MEWLFGRRMTPEEQLKKNQRALNKAMRELDRERAKMEQQEKKIINDIKKMAKAGQMDAVKIMAKVFLEQSNFQLTLLTLGSCTYKEIRQEIHAYAGKHSSSVTKNPNFKISEFNGSSYERSD